MDVFLKIIKKNQSNNGLTIVEVLIAITVLTLLAIAFISLIGFNFTNIFTMGEKSKAIAKAKEKTDELYAIVNNSSSSSEAMNKLNYAQGKVDRYEDLFEGHWDDNVLFYYEPKSKVMENEMDVVEGYEVAVVVFYHNNKYHIKLDSFIYQQNST